MGKYRRTCLNLFACGKRSKRNESKKDVGTEIQKKASKKKQRWHFMEGTAQHRVLSTTAISEPVSSSMEQEGMGVTVHDQSKQTMAASPEKSTASTLGDITSVMLTNAVTESVIDTVSSHNDVDRSMEEAAAITIQAAVRGYLAWKAFLALKGLVRLQAYVRGHLVRRQAAGSLRCVRAIVRLQALVRARQVRLSEQGLHIQEKLEQIRQHNGLKRNELGNQCSSASGDNGTFLPEKLMVNGFARQLLETAPRTDTLHIKYDPDKHSSGWNWLERWMSASPWVSGLPMQPNNSLKHQKRSDSAQLPDAGAENCRHNLSNSTLDSVFNQPNVEVESPSLSSEDPNFSLRKTSNSTSDSVSDHPKVAFEKSVRSSRKVSNSTLDSVSDQLSRQLRMVSNSALESVLDKPNVETENLNYNSRKLLKSSSNSVSDQIEAEGKKSVHSLEKMSHAKLDSVSNLPSVEFRKVSNLALDSVLDQPKIEGDNPQLSLGKILNSKMDYILDQRRVEIEDTKCDFNKTSNLTSGSVSDQLEAEAEKSIPSLRKVSNSTLDSVSGQPSMLVRKETNSTLDSILYQQKDEAENPQSSLRKVSGLTVDSVFCHPKIESDNPKCSLKKSLAYQLGAENEKTIHSSREVSNSALDSVLDPSNVEVQNPQFSLAMVSNSTFDSVADQPSFQLRKVSNLTLDSVLDQPKVETENTQYSLIKLPKSMLDSALDHIEVENNNAECSVKKASEQLEAIAENSKCTSKKSSYSALNSLSDQLEAEAESTICSLIEIPNSTVGPVPDQLGNASNSTLDSVSDQLDAEVEKSMHTCREVSHSTLDSVLDQPNVEAENPKSSLEKKSNSGIDSVPVQLEDEAEKFMHDLGNVSNTKLNSTSDHLGKQINMEISLNEDSNAPVQQVDCDQSSSDQSSRRQGTSPIQLSTTDPSGSRKPDSVSAQQNIVSLVDPIPTRHEKFESTIKTNLEHSAADLKAARRRISLGSGKGDHAENDSQGSPSVPHYMAPTESAKAKSRSLRSTTASPDLQENNSAAKRRISLPDSHGKQNSGSPNTQRSLCQALTTTKGNRVLSPRDATEKKIQTEWRR